MVEGMYIYVHQGSKGCKSVTRIVHFMIPILLFSFFNLFLFSFFPSYKKMKYFSPFLPNGIITRSNKQSNYRSKR